MRAFCLGRAALLAVVINVACGARPELRADQASDAGADVAVDTGARDTGADVQPPPPPPDPDPLTSKPIEIDLGVVAPDVPYTFTIPKNAVAFNVVVQGSPGTTVGVASMTSPLGRTVLEAFVPSGGNHEVTTNDDGIAAAEAPQTDAKGAYPIEAGTWTVRFGGPKNTKLRGSVTVQVTDDGAWHGGLLDVHFYVPDGVNLGAGPITASTAPNDPEMKARVAALFDRLALVTALGRGKVKYHAIAARYATLDTVDELYGSWQESKVVPDHTQGVHVVLTEQILSAQDGIWGIASGIPGAAARTGTSASGVAMSFLASPEEDADALIHEIGHFMGLSHTTEFEKGWIDPLVDTPSCADMSQSNLPKCPDAADVMFPTLALAVDETAFTPSQVLVYATNPAVRLWPNGTHKVTPPQKSWLGPPPAPSARARAMRCKTGVIRRPLSGP